MIVHNLDPVLIDLGFLQIRWYSLSYIFGILIGWWYGKIVLKKQLFESSERIYISKYDDLITYIIIGVIIGGRLGYVLFYNFNFYSENILEIFKIWRGGMSFHGGLIGIIIAIIVFSTRNNLNYRIYFDTVSVVAPIGIFLGRISNFINAELYGTPTQKPWGIIFPSVDSLKRHPSQIYEALLEGILLFIILNFLIFTKKNRFGFVSCLFLILYGFFRIVCEQFREPDEHIGYVLNNLSVGTVLSLVMILFGTLFLLKVLYEKKNK